jgi:ribosome biogenesis GTPase
VKSHCKQFNDTGQSEDRSQSGVVYKKTIGSYLVHLDGRVVSCTLPARNPSLKAARSNGSRRQRKDDRLDQSGTLLESLAVGDRVRFIETSAGKGTIVSCLERQNQISRRSAIPMPSAHAFEQVIAANLDQVVPVFAAARPEPKWGLLDRYLVSAESSGIPALVCITKIDLVEDLSQESDLMQVVATYRKIGYPVILVSALTGTGMDELGQALAGRTSALLGKSGVGKSSLLNWLQPGLGLRVNQVSQATGKGIHTTTSMEMFALGFGGAVVDTPGVREFGLWEVGGENLDWFFPEMRALLGMCRFGLDCRHTEEPACAIRKAVVAGEINPYRYRSYVRLREEVSG